MQATRVEDLPDVLTVQQVAEVLQCSDKHVYGLAAKGALPRIKVGRLVRIPKRGLVELLNGGMAS